MQNMVIVTSCDIDYNDELKEVPAQEVLWLVDGVPWVVDMCEAHEAGTSVRNMPEVARQYGRPLSERRELKPPSATKKRDRHKEHLARKEREARMPVDKLPGHIELERTPEGRVRCPWDACGRSYKNRPSMIGHFRLEHGVRFSVWEAEKFGVEPEFKCICGAEFVTDKALRGHVSATAAGEHKAVPTQTTAA